jgi:histone H4
MPTRTSRRTRTGRTDAISGITKPGIRRIMRRGGVKRTGGKCYEETRQILKFLMHNILKDSVTYMEHGRRKTVTSADVVGSLKKAGRVLYGFDSGLSIEHSMPKKQKRNQTGDTEMQNTTPEHSQSPEAGVGPIDGETEKKRKTTPERRGRQSPVDNGTEVSDGDEDAPQPKEIDWTDIQPSSNIWNELEEPIKTPSASTPADTAFIRDLADKAKKLAKISKISPYTVLIPPRKRIGTGMKLSGDSIFVQLLGVVGNDLPLYRGSSIHLWLNDEVIDAYCELMNAHLLESPGQTQVWNVRSSHVMESGGFVERNRVKKFRTLLGERKKLSILFPYNTTGSHWVAVEMVVMHDLTIEIHVFDSFPSRRGPQGTLISKIKTKWIEQFEEYKEASFVQFEHTSVEQSNYDDCGMFTLLFMTMRVHNSYLTPDITLNKMGFWRYRVTYELLQGKLGLLDTEIGVREHKVKGRKVDNTEPTRTKPTRRSEGSHRRHAPQAAEPKADNVGRKVVDSVVDNKATRRSEGSHERHAPQPEPKAAANALTSIKTADQRKVHLASPGMDVRKFWQRHSPQPNRKATLNALTVGQNRHTATPNALTLIRNAGEKRRAPQPEPKLLDRKLETLSADECDKWLVEFNSIPESDKQVREKAKHAANLLGLRYAHPGTLRDIQKAIRDKLKAGWNPIHPDRGGANQCFQLIEIARDAMEKSLIQRGKKT